MNLTINLEHKNRIEEHLKESQAVQLIGPCNLVHGSLKTELQKIYIDGGTRHGYQSGDLVIGDGDSSDQEMSIKLPVQKDFSDLAYALKLIPERVKNIEMLGFLGGRKDHELMVLADCHRFLRSQTTPVRLQFETQITAFSKGHWTFDLHGIFSLFLFEQAQVTLSGNVEYPIEGVAIEELSSHGLSNSSNGSIELKTSNPIFVFSPENSVLDFSD